MENNGLSLTDIKRDNRNLKRKLSKLRRKAETMRKLRTANYEMTRQIGFIQEEIKEVSSYMWSPPTDYRD
jgi:hypothetical protein